MMAEELARRLISLARRRQTLLVAIDGPGGAGKSTLARQLAEALARSGETAQIIHMDDFYLPSNQRSPKAGAEKLPGEDFDLQRLRDEVLLPLGQNRVAIFYRYEWESDLLAEQHSVPPGGIVIVEGVYSLHRELADFYDFTIWIDCSHEVRLARGLARDGWEARQDWEQDWMPAEDRYVAEQRPAQRASLRLPGC